MDYFHRLLLRASAQPRQRAATLFDPFSQTALWAAETAGDALAEAPLPSPAGRAAPGGDEGSLDWQGDQASTALPLQRKQARPQTHTQPARAASTALPASIEPQRRQNTGSDVPSATVQPAAAAAIAHADAFMRALGVPGLIADALPSVAEQAHAPAHEASMASALQRQAPARHSPPRALPAEPLESIQPLEPAEPTADTPLRLMRPPRPARQSTWAAPAAAPQASPAAAAPRSEGSEPAEDTQATMRTSRGKRFAPTSVVETTVVLPAPSPTRRLDDVAYGAPIERFGLGQS